MRPHRTRALLGVGLAASLLLGLGACTPGARLKGGLAPVQGLRRGAAAAALAPKKVAVLIGIDAFEDPFWTPLRFAGKDARDLAAALRDPALGGFDEVLVLDGPTETKKIAIEAALRRLPSLAPRAEDTVVVYVSSHGTLAPAGLDRLERVLVVADTQRSALRATGISMRRLERAFEALPSRRKALILATCHSGGGKSLLTPEVERALAGLKGAPSLGDASRASMVLSAADFGQPAREDDALQNDVYTHYFVEALVQGADADGDGAVSAIEAHDYARARTFERTEGRQTPALQARVVGVDPVLLSGRRDRPALPVVYGYDARVEGLRLSARGRAKGTFPGALVLEAGTSHVTVSHEEELLFEGEVELGRGERLSVDELLRRADHRWAISAGPGAFALLDSQADHPLGGILGGFDLLAQRQDAFGPNLDLVVSGGFGRGEHEIFPAGQPVLARSEAWRVGAGMRFNRRWGPLRAGIGPHLQLLQLQRSFSLPGLDERQSFGTLMPGALFSVAARGARLSVEVGASAHYLPLTVDGNTRSLFTASAWGMAGLRF